MAAPKRTDKKTAIYVLYDPRECIVRYVGKSLNPKNRYRCHISRSKKSHYPVVRWVSKLRACGVKPKMKIIGWFDDWQAAEKKYIELARKRVNNLNIEDGGITKHKTPKGLTGNFTTYRTIMATLRRAVKRAASGGNHCYSYSMNEKINLINFKVNAIRKQGPQAIADFYDRIHDRLSYARD